MDGLSHPALQQLSRCSRYDCQLQVVRKANTINCFSANFTPSSLSNVDNSVCGCVEPCFSVIYSSFVMSRKRISRPEPGSKIFIYYTSKMVTNIYERPGYDFSQFVADMCGSLGFLLGLSVIGLIVVLEKLLGYWFLNKFIESYKAKQQIQNENQEKPNQPLP